MRDCSIYRIADVMLALSLVPIALLLAILLPILNLPFNPGPLLFRQSRVGHKGTIFVMYKFRTLDDAGQATRFAKFLRASQLDEVPES